jgi:hypothetical protein
VGSPSSRRVAGSAIAILMVVGLSVAIPSVSSATSHSPGGTVVICTASKLTSLSGNNTGKVTITASGTGKGGTKCSIRVTGQWKKSSVVGPQTINASGSVSGGTFKKVSLTSAEFRGSLSGTISSPRTAKMTWTIALWIVYPPLADAIVAQFN